MIIIFTLMFFLLYLIWIELIMSYKKPIEQLLLTILMIVLIKIILVDLVEVLN